MRLAVLLLFAVCCLGVARADEPFRRVELDTNLVGYVVPESYAAAHKAEFLSNVPGLTKVDGFWTPGDTSVIVADRTFRVLIHAAMKDPLLLFPSLAPDISSRALEEETRKVAEIKQQRNELALVSQHFPENARQYVGLIVDEQKIIFCNYVIGTKVDPERAYIFTDKFFEEGKVHFLQCRFHREEKTCTNVSMIGPWVKRDD